MANAARSTRLFVLPSTVLDLLYSLLCLLRLISLPFVHVRNIGLKPFLHHLQKTRRAPMKNRRMRVVICHAFRCRKGSEFQGGKLNKGIAAFEVRDYLFIISESP